MSSQAIGASTRSTIRRHTAPRNWRRIRKQAFSVGFYLLVALAVVVSLFPFYWMLRTSLSTNADIARGVESTGLLPSHLSLNAYSQDFTQQHFLTPLLNSAIVALAATAITVVVATMAGYALARMPIRGSGAILAFILLAGFFPVLAMVGPLFLLFRNLGFLDSIYPLILAYLVYTLPIATWLLRNFFAQIPRELEEAALVDGATRLQALRKVVVPVALPGVFTAAILAFILAWNDFTFAVSFLETPGNFTAPLAIVNLGQSQFQVFYNRIDAAVVIVTIPIALLVLFAQRRIVAGLTAGSFR
ncbi:MAG TPA: carbohydrate ABC transporter permease [Solirubrobacteraceae bacterium]|nr:carbohydrate ABC transporter permease [Solirubrobacteraceae bacterium]